MSGIPSKDASFVWGTPRNYALTYYQDYKDLGVRGCAENLGIGYSTLTKWLKDFRESGVDILVRQSRLSSID